MTRDEAIQLVENNVKNGNLIKHMLATEAVMRGLAKHFKEPEEDWALVGLLHDIDYESTETEPERHTLIAESILKKEGLREDLIHAIKCHNCGALGLACEKNIEKAIYATDPVTGFIVACALVHPDKKLEKVDRQFVLNRMKKKDFARNCSREQMKEIKTTGLSFEDFIDIALESMKKISNDLGL